MKIYKLTLIKKITGKITQVFSTNPCFLEKLFTTFRVTLQPDLRKHRFVEKTCVLFFASLR